LQSSNGNQDETAWQNLTLSPAAKGSGTSFGANATKTGPSTASRETPDISYGADGYQIYYQGTFHYGGSGTSYAAPQWAAIVALADQGRKRQGLERLETDAIAAPQNQLLDALYSAPAEDFHRNGAKGQEPAYEGYNLKTGLGTPTIALVQFLMK
jgi:hypothetical protein